MQEEAAPTFRARKVCAALMIPKPTLAAMARDGVLAKLQLDAEVTVSGSARNFTLQDVFKLALYRTLKDTGLDTARATYFARAAVEAVDAAPEAVRTLRFGNHEKKDVFDLLEDPDFADPVMITVDLHYLFQQTVDRLRATDNSRAVWE
jgi:hypothetical protein